MKHYLLGLLWAVFPVALRAAEPQVIELWPDSVPGLKANAGAEKDDHGRYTNIHHPSLLVFPPPAGKSNGTGIIYAPGGGYIRVAPGPGGGDVTRWLNAIGITVFVLKYRNVEYGHGMPVSRRSCTSMPAARTGRAWIQNWVRPASGRGAARNGCARMAG